MDSYVLFNHSKRVARQVHPMHAQLMPARYDIRTDPNGWTVYDTATGFPAEVNCATQVGLPIEDADDLADLLNRLHDERLGSLSH